MRVMNWMNSKVLSVANALFHSVKEIGQHYHTEDSSKYHQPRAFQSAHIGLLFNSMGISDMFFPTVFKDLLV